MALSGFFGKRNISNLEVDLGIPDEVYASRETMLKVTLRNKRRFLPAFLIRVRIGDKGILFPFVEPQGSEYSYIGFTFISRGVKRLGDIYVCSVFPFNFFVRCRRLKNDRDLIVFPEPRECGMIEFESQRRRRGEEEDRESGYEGDLLSLRDYMPGDSLRYIHWKASAKTDQFKTKELSSLTTPPAIIDIDRLRGMDIEERLSCATYLVLRYSRTGIPFVVRLKGRIFSISKTSSAKREVLKELALYGIKDEKR